LRAALAHSGSLPGSSIDCIELRDNRLRWIILRVKEHRRIGRQFSQAELSKIAVPLELGVFDDLPETLKRRRNSTCYHDSPQAPGHYATHDFTT
jgi:hypothetical protein